MIGSALLLSAAGQSSSERARLAVDSWLEKFWDTSSKYLLDAYHGGHGYTSYWNYALGFHALVDASRVLHNKTYTSLLYQFYEGQARRGWRREFYDDMNWMAMALVGSYEQTHDDRFLKTAIELHALISKAWDTSCCGAIKGGIWWDTAHTQKATASNGGPVILSALLYEHTKNGTYLIFGEKVYHFWLRNMVNPHTYQVCDHMNPNGDKVWWKFTYNEGLMIGASVILYRITKQQTYLDTALKLATFVMSHETETTRNGTRILYDTAPCGGDCMEFKAPTFRYLAHLYEVLQPSHEKQQLYTFLHNSVAALWAYARDHRENLFAVNWAGPSPTYPIYQAQQNTACTALLHFAAIR
jgi:predicted alpha-1,6-mannanase (GH76 family)